MLKNYFFILIFITANSYSQDLEFVDTVFLDQYWTETKIKSEATYYRLAWFNTNDSSYLVHDYYIDTKTLQMTGLYKKSIKISNQEGMFKYYYKNGTLRASYAFKNGLIDGYATHFYSNGLPEVKRKYQLGKLIDTTYTFYEDGGVKEIKYLNPTFNPDIESEVEKEYVIVDFWNIFHEQTIKNGNGYKVEYYSNGNKISYIEFSDGFPHGDWIQYNNKKKVVSKMTFKNGRFISGMMYPKRKKEVFATLYRAPRYEGGVKAIDEFVKRNTGKCKEGFSNDVNIIIHIDLQGNATFDQIISGDVSHCQYEELNELVKRMPKWKPAIRYGQYVESSYVIHIKYS